MDKQMRKWGFISLLNTASLCIVVIVLVGLFAGWPIYRCVPLVPSCATRRACC